MPYVNKSQIRRTIENESERSLLSGRVVPYINQVVKQIVMAIIEADNESLTPESQKTLEEKHMKNALKNIDKQYGLEDLLMLELDAETYEIDLEKKSGDTINININLNEDDEDED